MNSLMLSCCFFLLAIGSGFAQSNQLSAAEVGGLHLIYEEERMAHHIYIELSERWDLPTFKNSSDTEKRHFEQVLKVYEQYGIQVPKNCPGFYNFPELNLKYDRFFEGGMTTLKSALTLASNFEETILLDLQDNLMNTQNKELISLYNTLLEDTKQHLRMLYWELKNRGEDYIPAYLEKREYRKIIRESNGQYEDCNCPNKNKKGKKKRIGD